MSWGDGSTSTGTITADIYGVFHVQGTHTYATTGTFSISVEIKNVQDQTSVVVDSTANVADVVITHGQHKAKGKPWYANG